MSCVCCWFSLFLHWNEPRPQRSSLISKHCLYSIRELHYMCTWGTICDLYVHCINENSSKSVETSSYKYVNNICFYCVRCGKLVSSNGNQFLLLSSFNNLSYILGSIAPQVPCLNHIACLLHVWWRKWQQNNCTTWL